MVAKLFAWLKQDAIRRSFGYYFLFICLGLGTGLTGPTLPALAAQTGSALGRIGLLFLAGSTGYTLGTMASGRIFDRLPGHPMMGIAQIFSACMLFLVPFIPWFWLLVALMVCKGLADGFINTGANTLLAWTHGDKVGPFMNALHFFFGLGAFISPLIVGQVIELDGGYRWAYWALAAFGLLVGLRMLTMRSNPMPIRERSREISQGIARPFPYRIVISALLFLFFYVGAEITFGGWIYTYATSLNLASVSGAAYLTSMFWGAFTAGRLISIPMATRFTPRQIIPTAVLGCLVMLVLGIMFPASSVVLWLATLGLGLCMAPIWPTGFTLAGQSVDLTGKVSAVILLGDSFGGMVLPTLVGLVIETTSPTAMNYLVAGSLVLNLLAFAAMLRLRVAKQQSISI